MVDDELIRLFALRGIRPIPMAVGVQQFLDVLTRSVKEEPELVITASLSQIAGSAPAETEDEAWPPPHDTAVQRQQAVA